jgi:hypothetical protein
MLLDGVGVEQLMEVRGVGPTMAANIVRVFDRGVSVG